MVAENNDMSFFPLFQYCLGSGLGTIGDFSSEQPLLTWPHWLHLASILCGLNVFSAEPHQHKLLWRTRRYSTTWHDGIVFRSAIYLCPYSTPVKTLNETRSGLTLRSFIQIAGFCQFNTRVGAFFTGMQERSII